MLNSTISTPAITSAPPVPFAAPAAPTMSSAPVPSSAPAEILARASEQLTRLGAVVEECAGSARRASRELVPFHETPVGREAVPEPDRVWLPNALVRAGHLARLRETHDPALLELLVSLYSAENLRDDGGLPRALIARTRPRTRRSGPGR